MVSLLNSLLSNHARQDHTVIDETSSASSVEERLDTKSAKSSGVDDAVVYIPTLEKVPADVELNPGELSFDEDVAGGMGRHLGVFSCTMLITGTIIGTGIFSTPSSILGSVGSVGASLMLWLLGFVLAFCGLFVWLEFGTMFPRSGGEKVYLEAVYRKPKYLATVIFAANAVVLGFASSSCVIFAENILIVAGHSTNLWATRGIALSIIVFAVLLHGLTPRLGVWLMNGLGVLKIGLLVFVVITGWVVLAGKTGVRDPYANFRNSFAGSSHSGNDYATAMFKVINTYAGWHKLNYVLNNVENPVRTLKIAGPLGLGICAVLYILANISYFAAGTKEEITESGVTVASLFFKNVFGEGAQKALTVFIALSALGSNVITLTFTSGRVNQELAKEGVPLPFDNRFWASNWPTGKSPLPGLIINLIPSSIVILAPPFSVVYPFILDLQGYPQQIINLLVVVGLFWLRWRIPLVTRPFKIWWPLAVFFLAASIFLLVAPFLPPSNGVGDTPPLPYYLYCLVGIAVMAAAVLYWVAWRLVPQWLGYEYLPHKETLSDGTVVTLFTRKRIE